MRVTVLLFARLRDIVGAAELERETSEGATIAEVWHDLAFRYQGLEPYGRVVSCALNGDFAGMGTRLADKDEVAFLPPVSGGAR